MRGLALLLCCTGSLCGLACQDAVTPPDNLSPREFVLQWEDAVLRVQLGEAVPLRLWLRAKRGIACDEPDILSSMEPIEGGKLSATSPGRWIEADEYRYWTRTFELVWLRLDERTLPAFEHTGKQGEVRVVATTEILDFEVRGSLGLKPGSDAEVPLDMIVDAPGPPYWPWIVGLAALMLAFGTGLLFLKKSRSSMRPIVGPVPLSADQEAMRRIKDLERQLEAGQVGGEELIVEVSDILRVWLQIGLSLSSLARTSEEFLASMREGQDLPLDLQQPLTVFIEQCDLVKFAAQDASHELCSRLLGIARQFVMSSRAGVRERGATAGELPKHG